jgi:hypothetical protein
MASQPDDAPSTPAQGVHLSWQAAPERIRAALEQWAGCAVMHAASQPTGFSPGVAARRAEDARGLLLQVWRDLTVDVRGYCVGAQAEALLYDLHRRAKSKEHTCVGVRQVVGAGGGLAGEELVSPHLRRFRTLRRPNSWPETNSETNWARKHATACEQTCAV